MHSTRLKIAGATAALILLVLPAGTAGAQERPPRPDDVSAISVYQEVMPTSEGPRVALRSSPRAVEPDVSAQAEPAPAAVAPLAPEVRRALRQAPREEAEKLEEIATSPAHGAPSAPREPLADDPIVLAGEQAGAGTTVEIASQSTRVIALVLALAAATAAAAALFLRRRRA